MKQKDLFRDYTERVLNRVQTEYNFSFTEKQLQIIYDDMLLHLGFNKQLYVDASQKSTESVLALFIDMWMQPTLNKLDRTLQFSK
jgi:uncharacterized protein YpuA (DUF1002 family)